MSGRVKCAQCGRDAIGFQSIGCGFMNVCEEHADSHILALRPGKNNCSVTAAISNGSVPQIPDLFQAW